MGSSMGGFMALKMTEYLPRAHAFSYNNLVACFDGCKHHYTQYLIGTKEIRYVSPEMRNRGLIHPEKVVNPQRCVLFLQNSADPFFYQTGFLPFLHWVKQNPVIEPLLFYCTNFKESLTSYPRQGLYMAEINRPDIPHLPLSVEFELSIIDRFLRFMALSNSDGDKETKG
jgi:hypothetical protein